MDGTMRASDSDREKVVSVLQTQYAEGRLSLEELNERSGAAYAARTMEDLQALTRDLPVPPEPQPRQRRRVRWAWIAAGLVILVIVIAVGITVSHFALPFAIIALIALNRARKAGRRQLPYEGFYRVGPPVPPSFPVDDGAVDPAERRARWLAAESEWQARQKAYEKEWLKRSR